MSGSGNLQPTFMPISFLRRDLVFGVSGHLHSNTGNPSVYWNATLSFALMAPNYANLYPIPILFWKLTVPWPA